MNKDAPADIVPLASRLAYENPWTRLREDRVRFRDGSEGIYGVVEKKDFVVVAAIEDGHIHLVEQYRYTVSGRFWELPQGASADATPLAMAHTELREETGLTAARMAHAGRLFTAYGVVNNAFDVFLATGLTHGAPEREREEQDQIARAFPLAAFERMLRDGTIKDAATMAAWALLTMKAMV